MMFTATVASAQNIAPPIITTMDQVVDPGDTTLIFLGGAAPAGSSITLSRAEDTFADLTTTTSSAGIWGFPNVPLVVGTNTFSITARNSAGQVSAPAALIIVRGNGVPVGLPTIDDTTPATGQELSAITSGISDVNGLVNSRFSYQWLADGNEISGATSVTFTPMQAQIGQTISVRVSYTDNRGFDETLTSAATAAVVFVPPPIITTMDQVVDPDGTTSIFISGEAPVGSSITLSRAEDTFADLTTTTNNDGFWSFSDVPLIIGTNTFSITARNSAGQVSAPATLITIRTAVPFTITTPATTTTDTTITIRGTVNPGNTVSISRNLMDDNPTNTASQTATAEGNWEFPNRLLVCSVPGTTNVFVLETTVNGDLEFAEVRITCKDTAPSFSDTIPDQPYIQGTPIETLTLPMATGGNGELTYSLAPLPDGLTFNAASRTLSGTPKVEGAYLPTYTATDADDNTDASDSATLTFSITVESATDLTAERVKQLNEAIMPRLIQAMLASTQTAISSRMDNAFSETPHSASYQINGLQLDSQSSLTTTLHSALEKLPNIINILTEGNNINIDWRQMLANSSFALSLQDDANDSGSGTGLSLWGSGDYSRLSGKDHDLDWDGEVFSIQLGADKRIGDNLLLGGLVSWSDGDVDIDFDDVEEQGSYQHQMTSLHPYIAWNKNDTQLWGSLGYGQGELEIELGRDKLTTDTRLLSLAGGIKGRLSQMLSLKSDISLARTDIDKSDYSKQQHINSQRLRLLLEVDLLPIGRFLPTLEAGLRYDGGDGDSGVGAVVDATIGYANPNTGLTLEGKLHTLLGRDDYTEWGISGVIALPAAADGRGLAFSLSPSYGTGGSGAQALWYQNQGQQNQGQQNQLGSLGHAANDYQARLDARLSYGFANGSGSLLVPYSEITTGASNSYRLGVQWQGNRRFHVNLYGERHESTRARAEHAILLEGRVQF